ncbi:MAG: ABC transporter permease [Opitutales bacterium]|nr:ABC transporter permease [Opitutales bacterium]
MTLLKRFLFRIHSLLGGTSKQKDLEDELRYHIDMATEEYVAEGMSLKKARTRATKDFGNSEFIKEQCRNNWGIQLQSNLMQDVRYGLRQLTASKGHTLALIFIFVFCIAPCTLVFSILNSLYLNPDRYPDENRVIRIYDRFENNAWEGETRRSSNPKLYEERRAQSELLDSIAAQQIHHFNIKIDKEAPEFLDALMITPSMFDVLRIEPFLGRRFYDSDINVDTTENVVIVTYTWWQNRLGGDPNVIGRSITIDGQPWEIVGVMPKTWVNPPSFGDWDMASIHHLLPLETHETRSHFRFRAGLTGSLARLKPGVTKEMVEAELASINEANHAHYPEFKEFIRNHPLVTRTMTVGEDQIRDLEYAFILTVIAAVFVMLAGSLSLANFTLARNSYRIQEFAVRSSLGATLHRLVSQLIAENALVALAGSICSIAATLAGLHLLHQFGMFSFFTVAPRLTLDLHTVAVALALGGLVTLISVTVSVLPLLKRGSLSQSLKEDNRTGTGSASLKKYRSTLVFIQSGIAIILLINGGLLMHSFFEVLKIDPGYETEDRLYTTIRLPNDRYDREERIRKMVELEERIRALPEVESVGVSNWPPMKHPNIYRMQILRFENPDPSISPFISTDTVSAGYFRALDISPTQGRLFTETDISSNQQVVVIDQALADLLFPGENPVGKRIALHSANRPHTADTEYRWQTVIGVINTVRINNLYKPAEGMVYQTSVRRLYWFGYVVKCRDTVENTIQAMKELLLTLESDVAVGQPSSIDAAIERRYAERKNILYFCLGLAFIALSLAILGISGVIAYSIAAGKKEIAIRLALGAHKGNIIRGSVSFWIKLAMSGMLLGLVTAYLLSDRAQTLLYGTDARDPLIYGTSTLAFVIAITIAAYLAAIKSTSIKPIEAMRT